MADYDSALPIRGAYADTDEVTSGDTLVAIAGIYDTTTDQYIGMRVNSSGALSIWDGDGSITVDGSVTVSATDLDIRDLSASQDNVAISDGTDTLAVNADGSINITDNGGSITVDGSVTVSATDLDIRDLSAAQDNVAISDGTDTLAVNADGSINAVISDGGGSITVDGSVTVSATDLDIRTLDSETPGDNVAIKDSGGDELAVNADGSINITDNGGSITVDGSVTVSATDLDIRDLVHTQDSIAIGDGVEDIMAVYEDGDVEGTGIGILGSDGTNMRFIKTASDGTVYTTFEPGALSEFYVYNTAVVTAAGAAVEIVNRDSSGTDYITGVTVSASGLTKIEIRFGTTDSEPTIVTLFNSTASPNVIYNFPEALDLTTGNSCVIYATSLEKAVGTTHSVYGTIFGHT